MADSTKTPKKRLPLMWTEALRALVCLAPMLAASGLGKTTYLVTLGQGGFLYSWLFLPSKLRGRLVMGVMLVGMGLAFYLVGGNVVQHPLLAVFFTFLVCLNLSFLSGWSIGGPLALTLIMIYTAGLNTGSPEKAAHNFMAFAFVLTWSAVISLLPFWKPFPPPPVNKDLTDLDCAEQGYDLESALHWHLQFHISADLLSSDGRQARWAMSFVSTRACQKSELGQDFTAP